MPVDLPDLPASITAKCALPVTLPDRALTDAEIEKLWAVDRVNLVKCGWQKSTLVTHYHTLADLFRAVPDRAMPTKR